MGRPEESGVEAQVRGVEKLVVQRGGVWFMYAGEVGDGVLKGYRKVSHNV